MKSLALLLIGVLFHFTAHALFLKGFVYENNSETPIQSASVVLKSGKKIVNETNTAFNGSFLISLKRGKSYTLFIEKPGFEKYSILIDGSKQSIPLMKIFMKPEIPSIQGALVLGDSGDPLPHKQIGCVDLKTDKVKNTMTDASGNFYMELDANSSYRVYFNDIDKKYANASIFISTLGGSNSLNLKKKLVTSFLAENNSTDNREDWDVVNKDADEIVKFSGSKEEVNKLKNKYNDSVYVVNKHKPIISLNKKKQKKREKELETIYFYAKLEEKGSMPPEEAVKIEEKIKAERISAQDQISTESKRSIENKTSDLTKQEIIEVEIENEVRNETSTKEIQIERKVEQEQIEIEKEVVKEIEWVQVEDKVEKIKVDEQKEPAVQKTIEVVEEKKETLAEVKEVKEPVKKVVIAKQENIDKIESKIETIDKPAVDEPKKKVIIRKEPEKPKAPKPEMMRPSRNTVYFAKGKSTLTDEAQKYLESFANELLENPKMEITISSHTDSDIEYTIEKHLARLRAETVMNYFLEKGVIFEQMVIRSVGNKNPVNRCKFGIPCTDDEHKMNRRVELIFEQNRPY